MADFSALFKEIVRTDKQTTVVLLNAIGYIYIQMTKVDYAGKDEFMVRTLKNQHLWLLSGKQSHAFTNTIQFPNTPAKVEGCRESKPTKSIKVDNFLRG